MPKRPKPDPAAAPARVTVRSIAAKAGVSIGLVSSVLNNLHEKRRVAPATADRVRAAAAELSYLPNISARRLRGGQATRNNLVLAIVTSFQAPLPVINHFILALREASAEGGSGLPPASFSLAIEMFDAGRLHELPGLLEGTHFNAAIITNTTAEDDQFLERSKLPYPVVLVNRSIPHYASAIEDPEAGGSAAKVLLQAGRKRLAVLYGRPLTQITRARVDAFERAVRAAGGVPAHEIVAAGLNEESADEAVRTILGRGASIDGLYAVTDGLALGAYRAIRRAGLTVPRDIAVVGVGDYEISPYFDPPLSAVGVSHPALAHAAARMLLQRLGRGGKRPERVMVPVTVQLRESTGRLGT